jgi:prepilin-type N-terminal cleavage/methylation domain-containing protein
MIRPNKGFTLMELLIVIGVLGILAAGLLAAIDPFEQLKKARDTNNRDAATELLSANQRYYASHTSLPWLTTVASCNDANNPVLSLITLTTSDWSVGLPVIKVAGGASADVNSQTNACITNTLVADGELKTSFFNGLGSTLYVGSGSPTRVVVCYAPEGKSNRNDASTKYLYTVSATTGEGTVTLPASGCTQTQKDAGLCLQCYE